jgi:competence protein ComEC
MYCSIKTIHHYYMRFVLYGLLVCTIFLYTQSAILPGSGLIIRVCNTGQGDAVLLRTPSGKIIAIDGGPNQDVLMDLGEFMPWFNRTIELMVLTHPDADHITALPNILRRYNVQNVLMTGVEHHSGRHNELIDLLATKNVNIITPKAGQVFDFGDGAILRTIWPKNDIFGTKPDQPNNTSIVLQAEFNNQSMLLTGDIEHETETEILASGQQIRSTYIKVPHHGSTTSSSTGFLIAVQPAMAIISAGVDNKFGHPHQVVVDRYAALHIPIWNTASQGDFEVVFR